MRQRNIVLWAILVLFFSWVSPALLAEEPATETAKPAVKQDRAAKYAARRNILEQMMPWEMRSDLNYLATLADHGLIPPAGAESVDAVGTSFESLVEEYLKVLRELEQAEKAEADQDGADRLTEEMIIAFDARAGMVRATFNHFNNCFTKAVAISKRWNEALDRYMPNETRCNLIRLAPLADKGVLPQDTVAQLDDDLKRLRELDIATNKDWVLNERQSNRESRDELLKKLDEQVKWLYLNLPTSPRRKAWEKTAKK